MDEKIKEVMGLVCSYYGLLCADYDTDECDLALSLMGIESKLRELVQIPPGYVLVPVEPTSRMINAGEDAFMGRYDLSLLPDVYEAILAAAPKETK